MKELNPVVKTAVRTFMGNRRVCYATPGTERHSNNFYGDTHICRFTRSELGAMIESFHINYGSGVCNGDGVVEDAFTLGEACDMVIKDMQFNRPE